MSERYLGATEPQWRALIWAFVRFITEGGPEPFAALQAAKRDMEVLR